MEYRTIAGVKVSLFGMGLMRLPMKNADSIPFGSDVDEAEAIKMIRYAADNGVNYFDTAYPYHGGQSETILGRALQGRYREEVTIATKLPSWQIKSYKDIGKKFNEQLVKLKTDYIDFYLLHSLNKDYWARLKDLGVLDFLDRAKEEGKIRCAGFSFHDETSLFKKIIDAYQWDFCQIQFNYLDENAQAGKEGLTYAGRKGVPVIVMEPLKGGKLAQSSPEVQGVWDTSLRRRSPVEWAFKWLYTKPEVAVILSGVSTLNQLKENIKIFNTIKDDPLLESDLELIKAVKKVYESKIKVDCTGCNYCMPCPSGVGIPSVFGTYNNEFMFGKTDNRKSMYEILFIKRNCDASLCTECGECEAVCPQHLAIIEKLKEAHTYFTD
ncbi:MAG: aldo/keto reductase [Spirochaetota bacterium]